MVDPTKKVADYTVINMYRDKFAYLRTEKARLVCPLLSFLFLLLCDRNTYSDCAFLFNCSMILWRLCNPSIVNNIFCTSFKFPTGTVVRVHATSVSVLSLNLLICCNLCAC